MAFIYAAPATDSQQTPTYGSKQLLMKSTKIDIAAGSGGATATDYDLGITLPKGAQVIACYLVITTAVAGGTISASTITIKGTANIFAGFNVFASGSGSGLSSAYMTSFPTNTLQDENLKYTLTHTGTGPATTGVIYTSILYVV